MFRPIYEFTVVVAGPGDANPQRRIVFEAIEAWNRAHSSQVGLRMRAIGWEGLKPAMGADPQSIVNTGFEGKYAALIAVFGTRLGTPTPRSPEGSGTVEEIELAMAACDHVMVYFYTGRASLKGLDATELARLQDFQGSLRTQGLLGSYSSNTDLRRKLDLHLAQLAYAFQQQIASQSGGQQANEAPQRRQPATRPEDQAILRILPGDKDAGPWIYKLTPDNLRAEVHYRVQNVGQAPARDIRALVQIGKSDPVEIQGPSILPSLATAYRESFVLSLPRPFPTYPGGPMPEDYPNSDVISITLFYSDFQHDLGVQQTEPFCFRFARMAEGAQWRSRLEPCEQAQEIKSPLKEATRPRNLTAGDHEVLETLVRRAARKPQVFQPTIVTHRMGDNKQLYASRLHHGAVPDAEDVPNFEHDRDFIPTLVQQGLLIPVRHNEYMMDESLFRAYGLEPPA